MLRETDSLDLSDREIVGAPREVGAVAIGDVPSGRVDHRPCAGVGEGGSGRKCRPLRQWRCGRDPECGDLQPRLNACTRPREGGEAGGGTSGTGIRESVAHA